MAVANHVLQLTEATSRSIAIIVEMRAYFSPEWQAVMAVPYTAQATGEFRVHRPKRLSREDCDDFDLEHAMEAFFSGVAGHEKGAAIWDHCLDESKIGRGRDQRPGQPQSAIGPAGDRRLWVSTLSKEAA